MATMADGRVSPGIDKGLKLVFAAVGRIPEYLCHNRMNVLKIWKIKVVYANSFGCLTMHVT